MKNKNKNSLVALIQATLVPLLSGVSLLVGRDRRGLGPGAWMDHLGPPSHSLVLHVVGLSTLSRHGLVSTEVLVVVRRGLPLLAELVTKPDSKQLSHDLHDDQEHEEPTGALGELARVDGHTDDVHHHGHWLQDQV